MKENGLLGRVPWRTIGWGGAALLLLLPLLAGAPWAAFDYVFMATMFGAIGLGIELAALKGNRAYMFASALALLAGVMLLVINGAVGIIGSERQDPNILFLGVVAIALLGSVVALFRAKRMVWAMVAAGLAQLAAPVAAWVMWPDAPVWEPEVAAITLVLAAIWLISAASFRKAAE